MSAIDSKVGYLLPESTVHVSSRLSISSRDKNWCNDAAKYKAINAGYRDFSLSSGISGINGFYRTQVYYSKAEALDVV